MSENVPLFTLPWLTEVKWPLTVAVPGSSVPRSLAVELPHLSWILTFRFVFSLPVPVH